MEQIENNKRNAFYMLRSYVSMIREMDAQDAKEYVLALADYALDGIERELKGAAKIAFQGSIIPLSRSLQNSINGKKGGAPKGNKNAVKKTTENNQKTSEKQPKTTEISSEEKQPKTSEKQPKTTEISSEEKQPKTSEKQPKNNRKQAEKEIEIDKEIDIEINNNIINKNINNKKILNNKEEINSRNINNQLLKEEDFEIQFRKQLKELDNRRWVTEGASFEIAIVKFPKFKNWIIAHGYDEDQVKRVWNKFRISFLNKREYTPTEKREDTEVPRAQEKIETPKEIEIDVSTGTNKEIYDYLLDKKRQGLFRGSYAVAKMYNTQSLSNWRYEHGYDDAVVGQIFDMIDRRLAAAKEQN